MLSLLLAAFLQDETVFYRSQVPAKETDVVRASKALNERIGDAGYIGIKALPLKNDNGWIIGIHSVTPIGTTLAPALDELVTTRGAKIELLVKRDLNAQEIDIYKPGEQAPAGCFWKPYGGTFVLCENNPLDISDGLKWSSGDKVQRHPYIAVGVPFLELSPALSIKADRAEVLPKTLLSIDGTIVDGMLTFHHAQAGVKGMRITGDFLNNKTIGICINHPINLFLKKSE